MSMAGALGGGFGDKSLRLRLTDTFRLAWADPDLRQRLIFVIGIFAVYALGVNIPVPIPGVDPQRFEDLVANNPFLNLINTFGGGGLKRISIFALGLNPYITASIIVQIVTMTTPSLKKELMEGGEYARRKQNRTTRSLTIFLCIFQGIGLMHLIQMTGAELMALRWYDVAVVVTFWTAGAMFLLWLGEQISERGIGNGVSLMIFAGIVLSFPSLVEQIARAIGSGSVNYFQVAALLLIFLFTTWFIVMFTIAQRRIPIQHMRRQIGTKVVGGATSYLPLSLNLAGVIPIIFAVSLIYLPAQFAQMFAGVPALANFFNGIAQFLQPNFLRWQGWVGLGIYTLLIFFFTYFYTAVQYNVEDIADRLKRGGSFIPGVRPGKQTKDFLDGVVSRLTLVGAAFLALVAMTQYVFPLIMPQVPAVTFIGGTSLLIMVSVALDTMRQIEANILMKQYT